MKLPLPSLLKDVAHGSQVLVIRCEERLGEPLVHEPAGAGVIPGAGKVLSLRLSVRPVGSDRPWLR